MRPIFLVSLASLTLAFAAIVSRAAAAEIYKWVDEKGVTNYSSAPPASARARRLDPKSAMVSVYTPVPVDAARLADSIQRRRIAQLDDELQAQRRAVAASRQEADYRQLARAQCLAEGRVACDLVESGVAPGYFVPGPNGTIRPQFFRPGLVRPAAFTPMQARLAPRHANPARRRHH